MLEIIEKHIATVASTTLDSPEAAENFRIHYLGKKGILQALFADFKSIPGDQKRAVGQSLNELKTAVEAALAGAQTVSSSKKKGPTEDYSRPGYATLPGAHHPISLVRNEIVSIFERMGFAVAQGPEMEDDWHNFSALNFPPEHPARDMQDTFFLAKDPDWALRTHTSSVQVRTMETQKPPIRIIAPGRVFRNEAISSRSHCVFHQVEGLYIDKNVSFADLKQTLLAFAQAFFGEKTEIRLRPSYFPFTEPSAEMDIWWGLENEVDYRMTKGTGWLEIMGCGMVDPAVLESCGIDPNEYSGYAFGMGIERIAMQRFQIPDIRAFYENDLRFLRNFQGAP
ncbi:MAG TPA: phenylalanine--tRNA ligase subunit alpha [Cryomorphaceae bacterium]|nr:phenylalanine--tRNA ligase subunit alpha [Cryomorphaceae bacterium]